MQVLGYSSNLYVWEERYKADGRDHSFEAVIRGCAEAGLDAVEPAMRHDPSVIRAYGLKSSGTYLGLALHDVFSAKQLEELVMPAARFLADEGGTDFLVNANLKGEWGRPELKTEEDLQRQGDNLSRIAELVEPLGLRVAMHNHAAGHDHAEGDLRSVVEFASPDVGLCVDTGWAHTAGHDPLEWIRRYPERIAALHLRNQIGSVPTEDLLTGDIDMKPLIGLLREIRYSGWLSLELWQPPQTKPHRTMIEDVRRSVQYLKQLAAG